MNSDSMGQHQNESANRRVLILAGPNGAGKTMFAREYLPQEGACPLFVNADLIAAGLSPFAPEQEAISAGRLMLERIDRLTRRGDSFAFETTLAGQGYSRRIREWQAAGYFVSLFFIGLPDAETCIARVAERGRQGGHFIPDDVVRRRFTAGRHNFDRIYRPLVDAWSLYDNAGAFPDVGRMGRKAMNENTSREPRHLDLQGSMAALRRAGQRAREEALRTHTDLIFVIDGKLVRIAPSKQEEEDTTQSGIKV